MKSGKLSRTNIIDLIDVIVRRNYIKITNGDILKTFFLNNIFCCCKKSCLLRDRKDIQQ